MTAGDKKRVVLLGTSGYHPSETRQTACLMLPELGLVLDAGTGMFRVRDHLQTDTLDIVLTHAHLDHVIGVTYLFDILWGRKLRHVTLHGEADKLAAVEEHLFAPALFPVKPPCDFRPLDGPLTLDDGATLGYFPLHHPGGAIGLRIDWPDRSLAYVTDTTAIVDAPYVEHLAGVDLLLHECHFRDTMPDQALLTGHSCTTPVAQVAAAAGVGRLVLVHVNPLADPNDPCDIEAARKVFAKTEVGHDGMELEV